MDAMASLVFEAIVESLSLNRNEVADRVESPEKERISSVGIERVEMRETHEQFYLASTHAHM